MLNSLYQVGGGRLPPSGRRYPAIAYTSGLKAAFAILIETDSPSVHPTHICGKCKRVVFRVTSGDVHSGRGCAVPREWIPHSRSDCSLCSDLSDRSKSDRSKGGRPAKKNIRLTLDLQQKVVHTSMAMMHIARVKVIV